MSLILVDKEPLDQLEKLTLKLIKIEQAKESNNRQVEDEQIKTFNQHKQKLKKMHEIQDAAKFLAKYESGIDEFVVPGECTAEDFIVLFKKITFAQKCEIWFHGTKKVINVYGSGRYEICWIKEIALTMFSLQKIIKYCDDKKISVRITSTPTGIKLILLPDQENDYQDVVDDLGRFLPSKYIVFGEDFYHKSPWE